ncbi:MoaD/ThiS family protein [Oceanispirochaeta sp.]|jgi:molybdopterin synthase sulfur carrier subunit|uniref:MoaD/ThiS family protein n=1 Tax=Oceanispirochaeta sp. TaxID=2035350 RepID=UPI00345DF729
MAEVILSGPLRIYTGGKKVIIMEGNTIWNVIKALNNEYPDWKDKLIRNGKLSMQMTILVNNRDIRLLEHEKTRVDKNSKIMILPTLIGG